MVAFEYSRPMKKLVKINGKGLTIKVREPYARSEKVVQSKKVYNRKKLKNRKEEK